MVRKRRFEECLVPVSTAIQRDHSEKIDAVSLELQKRNRLFKRSTVLRLLIERAIDDFVPRLRAATPEELEAMLRDDSAKPSEARRTDGTSAAAHVDFIESITTKAGLAIATLGTTVALALVPGSAQAHNGERGIRTLGDPSHTRRKRLIQLANRRRRGIDATDIPTLRSA